MSPQYNYPLEKGVAPADYIRIYQTSCYRISCFLLKLHQLRLLFNMQNRSRAYWTDESVRKVLIIPIGG